MSIAYFVCDANFWVDEGGLCFDQCDSMMLSGSFDRVGQWLLVGRMRRIVPENTNHLPKRRAAYDDVSFIEPCRSPSLLPL